MERENLKNIIDFINARHNPHGVNIRYLGHKYYNVSPHGNERIRTYDFNLSGGFDYILSVGTQVRADSKSDRAKTIFDLRDRKDTLAGDDFGYQTKRQQQVNVSVTGDWDFYVFQVALELSHTVLKGIYLHDDDQEQKIEK